jgi:hypothetical protein
MPRTAWNLGISICELKLTLALEHLSFLWWEWLMGQSDDNPEELARKIEQASRSMVKKSLMRRTS